MDANAPVNILLVDDQPAKLLSYEAILSGLGENLIKATSAREALERLLTCEIAVILVDVCMPELDGFEFAQMVREHPRFQQTAIIFVSAVLLTEVDALRGYEMGAVDYVPVPVVPEVLRAKIKVFSELYRKTKELETLNRRLEQRVAERTSELEAANARLIQSEQLRSLALAAGQMGSWDWDLAADHSTWDDGQCRIFGVDPGSFIANRESLLPLILDEDLSLLEQALREAASDARILQAKFRVRRPSGEIRSCVGIAAAERDAAGAITRLSGVTVDMTDLEKAQEHQLLLAREVDHRAKNALAVVQADRAPHLRRKPRGLCVGDRGADRRVVARSCLACELPMGGREAREHRRAGACPLSGQGERKNHNRRTQHCAASGDRPDHRSCLAQQARHERCEIRRAFRAVWKDRPDVAARIRTARLGVG